MSSKAKVSNQSKETETAISSESKNNTFDGSYAQLFQFIPNFNGNSNSILGRWYVAEGFDANLVVNGNSQDSVSFSGQTGSFPETMVAINSSSEYNWELVSQSQCLKKINKAISSTGKLAYGEFDVLVVIYTFKRMSKKQVTK